MWTLYWVQLSQIKAVCDYVFSESTSDRFLNLVAEYDVNIEFILYELLIYMKFETDNKSLAFHEVREIVDRL